MGTLEYLVCLFGLAHMAMTCHHMVLTLRPLEFTNISEHARCALQHRVAAGNTDTPLSSCDDKDI